jgi:UDP-N-acetylglucosamine 2-epimerase (non-hydrolysing)
MAPVIKELREYRDRISSCVCVTAQHRQLLDPFLKLFNIRVDHDLNLMRKNQSLEYITLSIVRKVGEIIKKEKPDLLLVQGDTTTSMAASLSAFYQKIRIAHVEAGLRTGNKLQPYPEEINRKMIDSVSDLYFTHTQEARRNLLREGVDSKKILVTGNTVIDALMEVSKKKFNFDPSIFKDHELNKKKIILVTAHRRENFGMPLISMCGAIKRIALRYPEVLIIYPVHLNPNVWKPVHSHLKNIRNILLTKPLDYLTFVHLMKISYFMMTDSGGLQEEAPALGKPVLILRNLTERPEVVRTKAAKIVGTNPDKIFNGAVKLLEDGKFYRCMSKAGSPFGDGRASKRIVKRILTEFKSIP